MASRNSEDSSLLFGELRSLLLQPASTQHWIALTELLSRWPDPAHLEHVAIPYASAHLERWDPELRAPLLPWQYALDHDPSPCLGLLGKLEIRARSLLALDDDARTARLDWMSAHLGEVRHLTLHDVASPGHDLTLFARQLASWIEGVPWIAKLESLRLVVSDHDASDHALALLLHTIAARCTRLESLHISGDGRMSASTREALTCVLDQNPYIHALTLHAFEDLAPALQALCEAEHLPPVMSLRSRHWRGLDALLEHAARVGHDISSLDLALSSWPEHAIPSLMTHPSLVHLSHLALAFPQTPEPHESWTSHWARNPGAFNELLSLDVTYDFMHSSAISALARRGVFTHLQKISLSEVACSDADTIPELLGGASRALRDFSWTGQFTHNAASAGGVFASTSLYGLEALRLRAIACTREDVDVLSEARHLHALTHLSLVHLNPGEGSLMRLAASPVLGRVRTLELMHNGFTSEDVLGLSRSIHLPSLDCLKLSGNVFDARAMASLVSAPWMGMLRELEMRYSQLSDGALDVCLARDWSYLQRLDLASNRFSADALIALCEHPLVQRVHWLNVHGNPGLYDEAFSSYLDEATHLPAWLRDSIRRQISIGLSSISPQVS